MRLLSNLNCQVTIGSSGTLDLSTNGNHGLGGTLTNNGTMNANVNFGGNGTLNNHETPVLAEEQIEALARVFPNPAIEQFNLKINREDGFLAFFQVNELGDVDFHVRAYCL